MTLNKFFCSFFLAALLSACGGDGGNDPAAVTESPSSNTAPVAHAGTAQNVLSGSVVTLDGSASSDGDNDALSHAWTLTTKPAGSSAVLSAPTSVRPTFTADLAGTYVATLVVNDGKVDSQPSTVTITASVTNAAPVANAGAAQSVVVGGLVTLDSSASSDANGDPLTYAWTLISTPRGSAAVLAAATAAKPTFVADVAGTYIASLVVNDGKVDSPPSTVTITASVANAAPVANAGTAQSIVIGNLVVLDGSASSDANGDALSYAWTLTSKPTDSAAALTATTSAKPTFTADVAGTYVATLVVNDGQVDSAPSTVTITAVAPKLALTQTESSFFGSGRDTEQRLPFTTNGAVSAISNCVGSACPTDYEVASFKLSAIGRSFTITNLQAVNQTAGSTVTPSFSGLSNGQVIAPETTVAFKLRSPFTKGATVNLRYSFTVAETGETFDYRVQLHTN